MIGASEGGALSAVEIVGMNEGDALVLMVVGPVEGTQEGEKDSDSRIEGCALGITSSVGVSDGEVLGKVRTEGFVDGATLGSTEVFCKTEGTDEGKKDSKAISEGCTLGTPVFVGVLEGSLLRAEGLIDGTILGISEVFAPIDGAYEGKDDSEATDGLALGALVCVGKFDGVALAAVAPEGLTDGAALGTIEIFIAGDGAREGKED